MKGILSFINKLLIIILSYCTVFSDQKKPNSTNQTEVFKRRTLKAVLDEHIHNFKEAFTVYNTLDKAIKHCSAGGKNKTILFYDDDSKNIKWLNFTRWTDGAIFVNELRTEYLSTRYIPEEIIRHQQLLKHQIDVIVIVGIDLKRPLQLHIDPEGSYFSPKTTVFLFHKIKVRGRFSGNTAISWLNRYLDNFETAFYFCINKKLETFLFTFRKYNVTGSEDWYTTKAFPIGTDWWYLHKWNNSRPFGDVCSDPKVASLQNQIEVLELDKSVDGNSEYYKLFRKSFETGMNITMVVSDKRTSRINVVFQFGTVPHQIGGIGHYELTYPSIYTSIRLMSHLKEEISVLEKMYNFYGILTIVATTIILGVAFVVIYFSSGKKSIDFAMFEILRLLINSGICTKIETLPLRIFFLGVFLYFLIIHATFEGNFAKFLTQPEFQKNIDNVNDLADFSDQLHITSKLKAFELHGLKINITSYRPHSRETCAELIKNYSLAICIDNYLNLLRSATNSPDDLYISKESLAESYPMSLTVRKSWPLKRKLNLVLIWLEQAGLMQIWNKKLRMQKKYEIRMEKKLDSSFKPVQIRNLDFAIVMLVLGLLSAAFCFVIERCLWRLRIDEKMNKLRAIPILLLFAKYFTPSHDEKKKEYTVERIMVQKIPI